MPRLLPKAGFTVNLVNGKPVGFTLAELLIALVILGLIATFTIPKVLSSQQSSKYKSIAKEVAGMISGAYQAYGEKGNTLTSGFLPGDITPYMNYVAVKTTGATDRNQGIAGTNACGTAAWGCLTLHNGAVLGYHKTETMTCTASNCAVYFHVDVDGVPDGVNKSVSFFLYANGRLTSWGTLEPNTQNGSGPYGPDPSQDPPWFGWN